MSVIEYQRIFSEDRTQLFQIRIAPCGCSVSVYEKESELNNEATYKRTDVFVFETEAEAFGYVKKALADLNKGKDEE